MKHPKSYETDIATSKRMSKVSLKKGQYETMLAKALWKEGFRYTLNERKLPGSPDIAIKKYHIAVFVDGEFWHGYDWEQKKLKIKRNREYWIEKIEENRERDSRNDRELVGKGWVPVHFWTKEIKKELPRCIEVVRELAFEQDMIERGF